MKKIYLIGICGTQMASLACLLKNQGYCVSGSDEKIYPPMSDLLLQQDIQFFQGYHQSHLTPKPDLVIIGNALSRGNPEVEAVLNFNLPYTSASEFFYQNFIAGKTSYCITGTHGKTTTASLLAWIFEVAKRSPGFMVGGALENFGVSAREAKGNDFIIEGDEYDTAFFDKRSKFLHYRPSRLILNNLEFDHADIFHSLDAIKASFKLLLRMIPQTGSIIANGDDHHVRDVLQEALTPVTTFGFEENNDARLSHLQTHQQGTTFNVLYQGQEESFKTPLFGEHNARNACATFLMARQAKISVDTIQQAFDSFLPPKRRLQLLGIYRGIHVFDDFAHHPTAVYETLKALKARFPHAQLAAAFEPRSATSATNIHQQELQQALLESDVVALALPYRQKENNLDVRKVAQHLKLQQKEVLVASETQDMLQFLKQQMKSGDVVVFMSNGQFDNAPQRLIEIL